MPLIYVYRYILLNFVDAKQILKKIFPKKLDKFNFDFNYFKPLKRV